jgi:hypothetical protein
MNVINKIKSDNKERLIYAKKMKGYLPILMVKDIQKWLKDY